MNVLYNDYNKLCFNTILRYTDKNFIYNIYDVRHTDMRLTKVTYENYYTWNTSNTRHSHTCKLCTTYQFKTFNSFFIWKILSIYTHIRYIRTYIMIAYILGASVAERFKACPYKSLNFSLPRFKSYSGQYSVTVCQFTCSMLFYTGTLASFTIPEMTTSISAKKILTGALNNILPLHLHALYI